MKNKVHLGGKNECYACKKSFGYTLNILEVHQKNLFHFTREKTEERVMELLMVNHLCDRCFNYLKGNDDYNLFLSDIQKKTYIKREEF